MAITLAAARSVLATAGAPYLNPLRALSSKSGMDANAISDATLYPAAISAGLFAAGVTPADPTAPTNDDMANLPNADWPKFLTFAELSILEAAVGVALVLPKSITLQNSAYKADFDTQGLLALLKAKQAAAATKYPDAVEEVDDPGKTVTHAWLTVPRPRRLGSYGSEF